MNIDRAGELLQVQTSLGSGYNRNSARLIMAEIQREHGQAAVNRLIRDLDLEKTFGLTPGTEFKAP